MASLCRDAATPNMPDDSFKKFALDQLSVLSELERFFRQNYRILHNEFCLFG